MEDATSGSHRTTGESGVTSEKNSSQGILKEESPDESVVKASNSSEAGTERELIVNNTLEESKTAPLASTITLDPSPLVASHGES